MDNYGSTTSWNFGGSTTPADVTVSNDKTVPIVIVVSLIVLVFILIITFCIVSERRKRKRAQREERFKEVIITPKSTEPLAAHPPPPPDDKDSISPLKAGPRPQPKKDTAVQEKEGILQEQLKGMKISLQKSGVDITQYRLYKPNDFRRELIRKHIEELKNVSKLSKVSVTIRPAPIPRNPNAISMDTSRAGSNMDVLRLCLKSLQWREYPNGKRNGQESCDVLWNSVASFDIASFSGGFINKFPHIGSLLHKINLSRCLDTMRTLFPAEFDFYPTTWYLPHQLPELGAYIRSINTLPGAPTVTFIVKPDDGTQGEGIYLLKSTEDYKPNSKKNHVVQEYLDRPLLLDGYKFDLRVYVLLWSIMPLKIYICREGLARFCTEVYEQPNQRNIHQSFMHLTNYSLNKHSSGYNHSQQADEGSKRTLSSVFLLLEEKGFDVRNIWRSIEKLTCRTIVALLPEIRVAFLSELANRNPADSIPHCFQILGFDVLLLENGKPMLLEVNSNPSLRIDGEKELAPGINEYYLSRVDVQVKRSLVMDTLRIVEEELLLSRKESLRDSCTSDKGSSVLSSENSQTIPEDLELLEDGNDSEDVKKYVVDDCLITVSGSCPKSRRREQRRKEILRRQRELSWIRAETEEKKEVNTNTEKTEFSSSPSLSSHESSDVSLHKVKSSSTVMEFLSSGDMQAAYRRHPVDLKDDIGLQESSLSEIYPGPDSANAKQTQQLNLLEKLPDIFHESLGLRQVTARMGPSAFRAFSRKANLTKLGFTNASIDLTFIDVQRRWEYVYCDCVQTGLSYQAFLEAFFRLAFTRYPTLPKRDAVSKLIDHCSKYMDLPLHSKYSQSPEAIFASVRASAANETETNSETIDKNQFIDSHSVATVYVVTEERRPPEVLPSTKGPHHGSPRRLARIHQKKNAIVTNAPPPEVQKSPSKKSDSLNFAPYPTLSLPSTSSQKSSDFGSVKRSGESKAVKELRDYLFRTKNKRYSHLKAASHLSLPMLHIYKKLA